MKRTKHYDKRIYERDKKIKTAFLVIIIFLIGMYAGLAINYLELQEKDAKIRNMYIQVDDLKEIIYQKELEEKKDV